MNNTEKIWRFSTADNDLTGMTDIETLKNYPKFGHARQEVVSLRDLVSEQKLLKAKKKYLQQQLNEI